MVLEIRMDKESSRGIGMRLLAPRLNNRNLIFSAPLNQHWPRPRPLLENQPWKSTAVRRSCVPPPFYRHLLITNYYTYTHIHTYMHSPPHPRSLASVALNRQPDKRVCDQRREMAAGLDGCLPELDYFPCCKVMCLWCIMCFCCWGVFPVLTLYSPRSIVWGLFFFLLTFLMLCCIFLQFPVFLSCLPPCHICMLCMDRLMPNFAGTCD